MTEVDAILLMLISAGLVLYAIDYLGHWRRWRGYALQGPKAAATSLYNGLGADVATIDATPG